jgi:hypothetical protein
VRYTLTIDQETTLDILLTDESGTLDTVLRLYDTNGNLLIENDNAEAGATPPSSALTGLQAPAGVKVIVEVGTAGDRQAGSYTLQVLKAAAEPTGETPAAAPTEATPTAEPTQEAPAAEATPQPTTAP